MTTERRNETEFAIGIALACIGGLLLYTDYQTGYWGIVALGLIFVVKNWPRRRESARSTVRVEKNGRGDSMSNSRLNH